MISHWTVFNGKPNRSMKDKMRVTINYKGAIILNRIAFQDLGRPLAVELRFDKTYGIIGIKPTRPDAHNAFPVKQAVKGNAYRINAGPFCLHFDVRVEKTTLFLEPFINPEGILILNLAKTMWIKLGSN